MLKEREAIVRTFLILVDGLIVGLAYFLAFYLRKHIGVGLSNTGLPFISSLAGDQDLTMSRYAWFLVVAIPLWYWSLYTNSMYHSIRTYTYGRVLWIVLKAAVVTSLGVGTFLFLLKATAVSRLFFFPSA
jgi:hypothetical protein